MSQKEKGVERNAKYSSMKSGFHRKNFARKFRAAAVPPATSKQVSGSQEIKFRKTNHWPAMSPRLPTGVVIRTPPASPNISTQILEGSSASNNVNVTSILSNRVSPSETEINDITNPTVGIFNQQPVEHSRKKSNIGRGLKRRSCLLRKQWSMTLNLVSEKLQPSQTPNPKSYSTLLIWSRMPSY